MDITYGSKRRQKIGIKLFCEPKDTASYYDVHFLIESNGEQPVQSVRSLVDWKNENITEQRAREKIDNSKKVFSRFKTENGDFSKCVRGMAVRFQFIKDYGPGGIILAEDRNVMFQWRR
jgi:hypothetical protein